MRSMLIIGMVALAIISRFFPVLPNFSPLMAVALFSGSYIANKKMAYLIPLSIMFLTDIFLGMHESMIAVYACFAFMVFMGKNFLDSPSVGRIFGASIVSSIVFFIVTNFSVWAFSGYYTRDFAGLTLCYELAIPFFKNTLAATLAFSTVLFGGIALAERFVPVLAPVKK